MSALVAWRSAPGDAVSAADVLAARQVLRPHIWPTPLLRSEGLSARAGGPVYLKLECWQRTGSFKVRGALNKTASLSAEERARGVVTASAGNHGLGLAYAARAFGLPPPVVFVPEGAAAVKLAHLAQAGCELRSGGTDYDEAHRLAVDYAAERGATYLSAYDDPAVIAGQGTVGLEILIDLPEMGLVIVPVGGGSLISGIALASKALRPGLRVVGVQPEASPAAYLSLRDGRAYEAYAAGPTVCDGLAGGFGRLPFELAGHLIDEVLVVPEAAIRAAIGWLARHEQLIVEGSGAIAVAPLLTGQLRGAGRCTVAVLTGRNLDAAVLREILDEMGDE